MNIPLIVEVVIILLSGGANAFFFHRQAKAIKVLLAQQGANAVAEIGKTRSQLKSAKDEITNYLDTHRDELKQEAGRLRANAQQMHDETQARKVTRAVPTRK